MEGIITFIVIMLIGSLFGGKKNKKETEHKQAKPFTAQNHEEPTPFKKLKEMSQEMYRELQQEMRQEAEPERRQPTIQKAEVAVQREREAVERKVEEVKRATRKPREKAISDHRKTRHQVKRKKEVQKVSSKTVDILPKTEEDIMKGIIFSEIFGPPKSKR